jgi:hypothetical protein
MISGALRPYKKASSALLAKRSSIARTSGHPSSQALATITRSNHAIVFRPVSGAADGARASSCTVQQCEVRGFKLLARIAVVRRLLQRVRQPRLFVLKTAWES